MRCPTMIVSQGEQHRCEHHAADAGGLWRTRFVLHNMTDAAYLGIERLVRQSMDAMVDALGLGTNALVLAARAESLP